MKSLNSIIRFFVLILLTSISFEASAQNLKPACQVGATWNYIYFTGGTLPQKTFLYTVRCIKDTIIGNNVVSVLEVDSNLSFNFLRFSYLAIDDSSGLYFKANTSMGWPTDTLLRTMRFVPTNMQTQRELVHIPTWQNTFINTFFVYSMSISTKKVYSSKDSIVAFYNSFYLNNTYLSQPMHPKYLNLSYGTNPNHLWGTPDFSKSFDSDYMLLNCYTDSSGTTKFIKEYSTFGCDYLGLKDILETKELVTIFPNPCSDKFFISESLNSTVNHIVVTNLLGEKMMESKVNAAFKQQGVDVSKWEPGIYFVNIRGNQINATQKLIIHH